MLPFSELYNGYGGHSCMHLWLVGGCQTSYGAVSFLHIPCLSGISLQRIESNETA